MSLIDKSFPDEHWQKSTNISFLILFMITTFHCSYINSNGFWPNAALIGIAISHKLLYSNMALTVKMNVKYDINWMKVEQKPTFMLFDAI